VHGPFRARTALALASALAGVVAAPARDWPQFLGPTRDGIYTGPVLSEQWGGAGPRVVWKRTVGQGLSGPVVSGGRVILFHRQDNREIVEAMEAATGKTIWRYGYPTTYRDDFGFDEGPRAVPVVSNGVVYTFGAEGQLHAVSVDTGRRVWSVDTARRFEVPKGFFGQAGSPLVEDGQVVANIGGRNAGVVAFDSATGKVLWQATADEASYSSGVGATFGGRRVAMFLTRAGLAGLDPASGAVVFQQPWRSRSQSSVNVATPLVVGDLVFISAEYGPGAGVFRVSGWTLTPLWTSNDALSNHYATSVHRDGVLYGFHGRQEYGPSLRAVELRTGKVLWSVDQFRAGTVTLAGDRLLIVRESGELILAPASPDAFKPIARASVLSGTVRAFPAMSEGFLYLRNEQTLACLDLRR
jgi:outer membrane protein assembly factor BamB